MRCLSLIVAVIMLNVICCTPESVKKKLTPTRNIEKDRSLNFVARRANQFSLDLFQKFFGLVTGNAVFAPYEYFISVLMASYPVNNSLQIWDTKAFLPAGDSSVNMSLGLEALVEKIERYKSFNFNSVNEIFYHMDFEPVAEFRAAMKKNSVSNSQVLDFDDRIEASEIINEWSKNTTQDRISNVVQSDDLMPDVSLYHVNVVHFKRSWLRPFTLVGDGDFYVDRMNRIKIPFMRQLDFFEYGELPTIDAVFVRIPYENKSFDDEMSMFVILPNKVRGFAELKKNIANVKMAQLFRGELKEILLFLPKFKVEGKFAITKPLGNQLSRKANVQADKPEQSNPFPRSKFIQRVLFEVDEKSGFKRKNASPTPGTPILKINRPFIFIITTTRRNRVILFTGCFSGSQLWKI